MCHNFIPGGIFPSQPRLTFAVLIFHSMRNVAFKFYKVEDVFLCVLFTWVFFLPSVDLFMCVLHVYVFSDSVLGLHLGLACGADLKSIQTGHTV